MEPAPLRRHTQRGAYDVASAKAVFDDCFVAHVSYVVDGEPACMPMIAVMLDDVEVGEGETPGMAVYLHGHPSSKIMELVRQTSRERESGGDDVGVVKVCITATKIDGLVLSSAPNGHTFNYRSATVHGTCRPVRDRVAKTAVMRAVTDKIVAGRWAEVNPVASLQVSLVYVVRVSLDRLSVKTRAGLPGIQPRDYVVDGPDLATPPWTGVVPLWEQLGEPVASGLTPGAGAPSASLRQYIDERNAREQEHAQKAAMG
ncbi:hypothetical protein CMQ_7357 [Grosmannia clavigera kw1407]|uniref:Flavin-nucleotide-binding protein n=1 Tax=Grosmannia clavigera (strain kw1407 / UAMH 11150) TaxID=655863 RepID=F0XPH2_GROCL|nr:uncharacterized protein CMQ_7357 [Grosmannia clavigera kw1407]EFX00355.1 hypothetical protein CMQ_7357 [Grosmannia clavigera kw1407]